MRPSAEVRESAGDGAEILARFPRGRGSAEVRATWERMNGRWRLDLRIWERSGPETWRPTPRSVPIFPDELAAFAAALASVLHRAAAAVPARR